ncbi:MAG: peroxiredoxin [Actinobacteria bacterium]|nr:peroxiredoxin [Actinomycetota bacterium]
MPIEVGDAAPDLELPDQSRHPVRLSDFRGKKHVVLVFYPMSFTRVCETELLGLRDDIGTFQNEDVAVLAVSCDATWVHREWARQKGLQFPVLSDFWPHGEVAKRYGVFDDRAGVARRGTFIIDRDGTVRFRVVNDIPEARDQQEYERVLKDIGAI